MISLKRSPQLNQSIEEPAQPFSGKRAAMVLFSYYPADPRPRRAAEALAAKGLSVELICLRENAGDARREQLNGVDIRRVPISRRRGGIWGYFYQYMAFLIVSSTIILTRSITRRYDLVYVNNMPDFLVVSGLIPKLFGAKVILDLHDPMPELMQTIFELPPTATSVGLLRRIEKWSIGLADGVITVNRACAKIFATRSCSREKITVVMNTPDEEIFRPHNSARVTSPANEGEGLRSRNGTKPFVVMYHGSLVERNGLALAVDAFARVRERIPSAELRIYGSRNSFLDGVMESVGARGLEDVVRYMGQRPLEQIVEAIDACDVGIIPNLRNIFTELNTPTRIFEYLALGKPVIAPRAPGITDYFDKDSLVFFELGDAADLARKIEYVFHNPGAVKEVVRRAGQIHSAHTWREERSRLISLVSQLLGDPIQSRSAVGAPQDNQQGR